MPPIIAITASSKKPNPGKSSNNFLNTQQKAVIEKIIATIFCSEVIFPKSSSIVLSFEFVSGEALKFIGKIKEVKIGMSHRGRLNVLANVLQKSYKRIFNEFAGEMSGNTKDSAGDVKYHLGASSNREFDGNSVHVSLTDNPSHLEAVNPVVLGQTRAKQFFHGDKERNKVGKQTLQFVDLLRKKGLGDAADDLLDSYKNNIIKFGLEVKKIMRKII